jgi:hypothetical protein
MRQPVPPLTMNNHFFVILAVDLALTVASTTKLVTKVSVIPVPGERRSVNRDSVPGRA